MRRIILSSVVFLVYNIVPHFLINGTIFGKKLLNIKCFNSFHKFYLPNFSFQEQLSEISLFFSYVKLEFPRQIFQRYSNVKRHEYPSSGSRIVPCGRQTDTTKLIIPFRNFANPPKNGTSVSPRTYRCQMRVSASKDTTDSQNARSR